MMMNSGYDFLESISEIGKVPKFLTVKSKPLVALFKKTEKLAENEKKCCIIAVKIMSREGWLVGIKKEEFKKLSELWMELRTTYSL